MEVWDPLGNVMILAEGVAFLAHDSVLALSPYLLQRINEERTKVLLPGWIPVIRLDEPAADLRHFLRALSRSHDELDPLEPNPSFESIWACATLGQKYERPDLRDQALAYVKSYCTDNYDSFHANGRQRLPPGFEFPHAIGLLNLARYTNAHTLLPLVIMSCTMIANTEILVNGWTRADVIKVQLTSDDLALCIAAERRMVVRAIENAGKIYKVQIPMDCVSKAGCQDALVWLNIWHAHMVSQSRRWHDPLKILWGLAVRKKAFAGPGENLKLCKVCRGMLRVRQDEILRRTWRELPCILDIHVPGWPGNCPVHCVERRADVPGVDSSSLRCPLVGLVPTL
ncbi:hypothetical protein L226DRAFT_489959 [Lentinus tigrinus ALCF2SS1-7]|nr:hypothetical protein L226DRAFT_489959 [Lentinus tigrinus ALCF2SS1-7]